MFPVVQFPAIVEQYAHFYAQVFSPADMVQFERYVSGLLVSENKTVEGINRLVVYESRHQSTLNRLLTERPFSLEDLNKARLEMLASLPGTQMKRYGVLSIDDTLLTHYGEHFEQIAYLYDPDEKRYTWAHNLVTLHYSDEQTDYPVLFQLWQPMDVAKLEAGLLAAGIQLKAEKMGWKTEDPKRWRQYLTGVWQRHQQEQGLTDLYQSKLVIAKQLISQWIEAHPDQRHPLAIDTWYTQPAFLRYLDQELDLTYVGTLAEQEHVELQRGVETLHDFANQLKVEHLAAQKSGGKPVFQPITIPYKGGQERYYAYCHTHRIKNFGKQRLVIDYRKADLSDNPRFLIANRLHWQALGIIHIRRHRWPVEVYHEEGKAEGLDQYQLRDFAAIGRHIAIVAVVYSLLRAAQQDPVLRDRLQGELQVDLEGSAAFWRRVMQAQSLWNLALLIATGLSQGHSLHVILAPWLRAITAG